MNYKDLADAIYPDAKDIDYYEKMYPARNMPEGAEVVRIGPSPTGFVHVGTIYQALLNQTVARQSNGIFYVRIEDTDQNRKLENGATDIINSLKNFDIDYDEGMISEEEGKGEYGPYKQSQRLEIYHAYAKWLIAKGRAYPCFSTQEEVEEIRAKQEAAGLMTGFYGVWAKYRDLPVDEAIERIKNGDEFVIRLRSHGREDRKIRVKDCIKGKLEFPENYMDHVLIKKDGFPVYHFAHAVDDHLMHTTTVVRGEEWMPSLPLHIELFQALENEPPRYAHTPNMLKDDNGKKRKISKRKDPEAAVSFYITEGIPSISLKEYLMNIINSSFEGWRRANPDLPMSEFKMEFGKMSASGAIFDTVKLLDVSKNVIAHFTAEEIYDAVFAWSETYDKDLHKLLEDKDYSLKVFGIERDNSKKPRKDISKWSEVKENIIYMYERPKEYDFDKISGDDMKKVVKEYMKVYSPTDDKDTWFNKIKDVAENQGYAREVKEFKAEPDKWPGHVGDVSTVIRVAVTGRRNTPDLYEILKVLGEEEVKERLKAVL